MVFCRCAEEESVKESLTQKTPGETREKESESKSKVGDEKEDDDEEEEASATRPTKQPPAFYGLCGRRCLLGVSTSLSGSERPRTGLLSLVSPNQKTGSTPYADWSTTATVNTVIGQSVRVTHGYRLPQQYLRSISPP